jgi:ComF family protein
MTSMNYETVQTKEKALQGLLMALKDLCFPPHCLCCSLPLIDSQLLICKKCLEGLQFTRSPLCTCCGVVFPGNGGEDHLCSHCIKKKTYFRRARSLFIYGEDVASLVAGLKYSRNTAGLETFRKLLQKNNSAVGLEIPDHIVPVPLHPKKLRQRGFNQALLLARSFFPGERKKIRSDILVKIRETESQTGLSGTERRKNLRNAFQVNDSGAVSGKKLLLVDDVYTTGTTVRECARMLMKAGAVNVDVLTLARVKE